MAYGFKVVSRIDGILNVCNRLNLQLPLKYRLMVGGTFFLLDGGMAHCDRGSRNAGASILILQRMDQYSSQSFNMKQSTTLELTARIHDRTAEFTHVFICLHRDCYDEDILRGIPKKGKGKEQLSLKSSR